jgi:DNA-binding NtrC family response regulator
VAKILIIDDDQMILDSARLVLERHGHQTTCLREARLAESTLAECGFDLLITDILMPEMDGFELIQAVQRSRPGLPILAQSSCNVAIGPDTLRVAEMLGAVVCLEKPYTPQELLDCVDKILSAAD